MASEPKKGGSCLATDPLQLIDCLDPVEIRERLSRNVREGEALRRLLRLAQRTAKVREDRGRAPL